jgi:hypothetical protein
MKNRKLLSPAWASLVLLWLLIYIPAYADSYGFWHFLQLCNLGVLISSMGLLTRNGLLISSQAIATPVIALLWLSDFFSKLLTGHFIHGGTAYMWDENISLITRVLSLYHLALPAMLLWFVAKNGYEKSAWKLQSVFAIGVLLIGLYVAPASENLNYVYHWPGGHVLYGQTSLHACLSFSILIGFVYWPTHRLLMLIYGKNK